MSHHGDHDSSAPRESDPEDAGDRLGQVAGYRYGRFQGGPDPLAAPVDLRAALAEIGNDVMDGSSTRAALRELLRRGLPGRTGLDELTRRIWEQRSRLQRRHRVDGTLSEVRELLARALAEERRVLFPEPTDDARFREMRLDALSTNPGRAVRELGDYDWRSEQAGRDYRRIRELLGEQLLDARFEGMRQALRDAGPEQVAQVRAMLADLNALLAAHAEGVPDVPDRFAAFMAEHGRFFPEQPRDIEELIDVLAARAAAAARTLNSLSPQQRAELAQLSQQAFGDARLAASLGELDARLQNLRPGEDWRGSGRFRGTEPLSLSEAAEALTELGELDELAEQLGQAYPGARLEDVDLSALERRLGADARIAVHGLADLERELTRTGLVDRSADGDLRLTPRALRSLGQDLLRDVVEATRSLRGIREGRRAGTAGEPTGAGKPWSFGDSEPWDAAGTARNAVLRKATGPGPDLVVDDIQLAEIENRTRAAVVLCVDVSWSMVQDGRWAPMKRTALALHHLITTRFRGDHLQLVTFGRRAARTDIAALTELEATMEQGTNLHHALALAGRHLRRHSDAMPVVLVVTDGEPTAHLETDGEAVFDYPPTPRTMRATMAEVEALARMGTALSVFRLGQDERLAAFVDLVARRTGGRVYTPDVDGLGAAVVQDYLHIRRSRR
ncbi:vWA domain-containing protein [Actinoalloteichus hymeniacidonis]|uniref:VWFA domain-containing protein n=1 Tax=Actinoalloteichus hymeniacidonis TaxID=340345 RepID=A0AAC9MXN4_9PSEU|nr:VWA domain-containing protein [Actinoalloteichus hymeniacidonis]AOS63448.1 hypothetical protein TL08_13170 [Actinoalloteichus hymeniacidonis]MBB5908510.1 uncharacterized protein with von Willebrand factor type A (vWA) domain [Actinoalloteichus hymeniacidonis]